jgi:hypothetical protein
MLLLNVYYFRWVHESSTWHLRECDGCHLLIHVLDSLTFKRFGTRMQLGIHEKRILRVKSSVICAEKGTRIVVPFEAILDCSLRASLDLAEPTLRN